MNDYLSVEQQNFVTINVYFVWQTDWLRDRQVQAVERQMDETISGLIKLRSA